MTYVLGAASVTNAPLRLQFTVAGDGWDSLGVAYGVPAINIIKMQPHFANGGTISNKSVQSFIKALPGWNRDTDIFAFDSRNNPGTTDPQGKPEGFAHFGPNTQLMLPDMPRLDGKVPKGGTPPSVNVPRPDVSEASMAGPIVAVLAVATGLLIIAGRKKRSKKPSPKPVTF